MASLQHKESYRLKPSDRARKSDDLFPFFGSDTVHRIQLITALGIDLLYICLKRFPGIGVCVLNLVGQQNSCHFPDSRLRFQASIKLSYLLTIAGKGSFRELVSFGVHHCYALLSCMQIAAYNLHLGMLRPEPFRLDTGESTRPVPRPTSLRDQPRAITKPRFLFEQ